MLEFCFRVVITMTSYERDGVSNHRPHNCLLNRLFRSSSKQTSKLRVTGLCEGNSPVTGEFPTQIIGRQTLLQLHLHSRFHTWLQWIGQRLTYCKTSSSSSSNFIPNRIQQYNRVCMTNLTSNRVIIDIVMWFCWWHRQAAFQIQYGIF